MSVEANPVATPDLRAPPLRRAALDAIWGRTPLRDRLGLRSRHSSIAARPSTAMLARTGFYLLSAGATATLTSLFFDVRDRCLVPLPELPHPLYVT